MANYEPDDGPLTDEQIEQLKVLVSTMNDLKFTTAGDYMNTERIREFVRESRLDVYGLGKDRDKWEYAVEKFAELIVKECADIANKAEPYKANDLIKKHFGVE
jgi:hypothetical protein